MISNLYNLKLGRKLTLLFALLAVTISWTGGLQSQSDEYVTEALQSGAIVYATARGINGVVSFIQGTELNPAFVTFAVGEFLDPVNDLIEMDMQNKTRALGSEDIFVAFTRATSRLNLLTSSKEALDFYSERSSRAI